MKRRTTVYIEYEFYKNAIKKADTLGISLSAYFNILLSNSLKKAQ